MFDFLSDPDVQGALKALALSVISGLGVLIGLVFLNARSILTKVSDRITSAIDAWLNAKLTDHLTQVALNVTPGVEPGLPVPADKVAAVQAAAATANDILAPERPIENLATKVLGRIAVKEP